MPQTEEEHQLGLEEEEEESVEGGVGRRSGDSSQHRNTEPDIEVRTPYPVPSPARDLRVSELAPSS